MQAKCRCADFSGWRVNAGNAVEEVQRVGPFALDLCSSVRTHGKLDEQELASFFEQVSRQ